MLSRVGVTIGGFRLMIGFIEKLQIATTRKYSAVANSHPLQHTIASLLSLLCHYQSLPGEGFQYYPLLPC